MGEARKVTNSRDNLRSVNQTENSFLHSSIDKHIPKDLANGSFVSAFDSKLYRVDAKNSSMLHSNNSKKLLNCSGDRSLLKYNHDDKENKQRLANKDK